MGQGPRGLLYQFSGVPKSVGPLQKSDQPLSRYVCQPREQKDSKVLFQVASPRGVQGGRLEVQSPGAERNLRKSTLEHHPPVVTSSENQPRGEMSSSGTLLGFNCMVAPVNSVKNAKFINPLDTPQGGFVSGLLGKFDASPKEAPGLLDCIRQLLQLQEVQVQNIDTYIKQLGSVDRYDSAFRKLYVILKEQGVEPISATIGKVAEAIIALSALSHADARNAYCAMLLLPGFAALRFAPLLMGLRKKWNISVHKYASF